jgi:hypothetical protein
VIDPYPRRAAPPDLAQVSTAATEIAELRSATVREVADLTQTSTDT